MRRLKITYSNGDLNLCYKVEDRSLPRTRNSEIGARGTFNKVIDEGSTYAVTLRYDMDEYIEYQ